MKHFYFKEFGVHINNYSVIDNETFQFVKTLFGNNENLKKRLNRIGRKVLSNL